MLHCIQLTVKVAIRNADSFIIPTYSKPNLFIKMNTW